MNWKASMSGNLKMPTHCDRVLGRLEVGPITPLEAWSELGIYRLGARIHDLRKEGWKITKEIVTVTNKFGEPCFVARYTLHDKQEG